MFLEDVFYESEPVLSGCKLYVSLLSPYCLLLKMWASAKAGLSNKEEARETEIEGVLGNVRNVS